MQENTQWYESTHGLRPFFPRKPAKELSKTIQTVTALELQSLVVRLQCTGEWLAVKLVTTLPRPLGLSLRHLFYPLFFAHTGQGLHIRARQTKGSLKQANQLVGSAYNKTNPDQTDKARSLYESCLRGYLKDNI